MKHKTRNLHSQAILLALLVTFLWSTSWVLIKLSFSESLQPLTFAGIRYSIASLCLAPLVLLQRDRRTALTQLSKTNWLFLFTFGFVCYAVAQGALFLALQYIPAAMTSLLLNLTPVTVGLAGMLFLHERPSRQEWVAVAASVLGVLIYFKAMEFPKYQIIGMTAAFICALANTGSTVLGRYINSRMHLPPMVVTFASMGFGSILLLTSGLMIEGIGLLTLRQWLMIAWLAIINTALAWSLWNKSLRVLAAVESSILSSLMLPQTVLLAMVFLGEMISIAQATGLILVGLSALLAQLYPKKENPERVQEGKRARGTFRS